MSVPELSSAIAERSRPARIDVVRVKRHLLSSLSNGQSHYSEHLINHVAGLLGAEPLRPFLILLPNWASIDAVITAEHPAVISIRAHLAIREALAELAAEGMLIAAGNGPLPGIAKYTLTYEVGGASAGLQVDLHSPAVLSDAVRLPFRLRQQGLWGIEADIFIADLAPLELDPRTQRSLREAIQSYHRSVFLAAASLLGAAVEGAWYAAGQRLRSSAPAVDQLVDSDRTAQLQAAVADALRTHLPGNRHWEADSLSQFARLMRDIRNYGVHPRQLADGDIEIYFEEDKCGLLFLEAHRHLKRLAEITGQAQPGP